MKKEWCRKTRTMLHDKHICNIATDRRCRSKKKKDRPNIPRQRWVCPDCKRRFITCSSTIADGCVIFWGPPHKRKY